MRSSIFSRLMAGYLFLLALATSMSIYTIIQLDRVRDVTHSVILEDNALLEVHKNLTDALLSETRYEKKFVIMNDHSLYKGFLTARHEFESELSRAFTLAVSPALQDVLLSVAVLHGRYQDMFGEEADRIRMGISYDAAQMQADKERIADALIDELQKMRMLIQQSVFAKITKLNEAGASASNVTLTITAVSLILGVVMSVLITRSITVPLAHIRKKTTEISAGTYDADLRLSSPPEIGELAQAVNSMSAKLKEIDRLKADFYALMSHELRTPLTSIKEGTNLLIEGTGGFLSERQQRILSIISEESNRLIGLVNSLLDLSRLEAGMLNYHYAKADLGELLTRAAGEVAPLAEANRIKIEREIGLLPLVRMDSERILQVLRNLIGNALKFTPSGGIVRLSAHSKNNGVIVAVADTGPGIPKEYQAAIFDKFRQAAVSGRTSVGTGLGLAIVKHIVEDHGGKVWVDSEEGCGSSFYFFLPA